MTEIKPIYLGDGVYAQSDLANGFPLVLTTGNHEVALADNKIFMEPEVLQALINLLRSHYKIDSSK